MCTGIDWSLRAGDLGPGWDRSNGDYGIHFECKVHFDPDRGVGGSCYDDDAGKKAWLIN